MVRFYVLLPGSLQSYFNDRTNPLDKTAAISKKQHLSDSKASQLFGNAAQKYIENNGADHKDFAGGARISHMHSQKNPYAQFQQAYSGEDISASPHTLASHQAPMLPDE
jgi:sterol carrier protein 2